MSELKIAAAYIRVSTDDQLDYSPESQLDQIRMYAKNNNFIIPEEYIFAEPEGHSGRKAGNRAEFQRMIAIAKEKPKPFDAILVWKFSRFARNQDESTFYKSLLRKKLKIDVISVSEPVMEGMYGRLIEMIIEWQDEFYSYNLGMEVTRGMTKKAQKGEPQVAPPLGYRVPYKKASPEIVPEEAEIVRLIFKLYLEGKSPYGIARHLSDRGFTGRRGGKIWSDMIARMLKNPYYCGYCRWNGIIQKGSFPAIISEEDFAKANERLNKESSIKYQKPSDIYHHWLSGIVYCSSCGRRMTSQRAKSAKGYSISFQCAGYTKGICRDSHYIRDKSLEKSVITDLEEVLSMRNVEFTVKQAEKNHDTETNMIQNQINRVLVKLDRARDSYLSGIDTLEEYKAAKTSLTQELNSLREKESKFSIAPDHAKELMLKNIQTVCDILKSDEYDTHQKNAALKSIIEKIVFDKKNSHIDIFYYLDTADLKS